MPSHKNPIYVYSWQANMPTTRSPYINWFPKLAWSPTELLQRKHTLQQINIHIISN